MTWGPLPLPQFYEAVKNHAVKTQCIHKLGMSIRGGSSAGIHLLQGKDIHQGQEADCVNLHKSCYSGQPSRKEK